MKERILRSCCAGAVQKCRPCKAQALHNRVFLACNTGGFTVKTSSVILPGFLDAAWPTPGTHEQLSIYSYGILLDEAPLGTL